MNHTPPNGDTQRLGQVDVARVRGFPDLSSPPLYKDDPEKPPPKCDACRKECARGFDIDKADWGRRRCCFWNFFRWQRDFMEQKSTVQEMVESAGHMFLLLPKFHPELNWIEMVWGYVKAYVRKEMQEEEYPSLEKAIGHIHDGFDRVDDTLCKRFQRLAFRYVDALRNGATGILADWLVKKYKSHRALPPGWEKEIFAWIEADKLDEEDLPAKFAEHLEKAYPMNKATTTKLPKTSKTTLPIKVKQPKTLLPKASPQPKRQPIKAKAKKEMYAGSYSLDSEDSLVFLEALQESTVLKRGPNGKAVGYEKQYIYDKGIPNNKLVQIVEEFEPFGEFGMVMMNTGSSKHPRVEDGYHWVWAAFLLCETDEEMLVSVQDPLSSTTLCRGIRDSLDYPGSNIAYQEVALRWQQDGWRCGYFCLYAMLSASLSLATEKDGAARDTMIHGLLENPKESYKEMPDGFVEFVWSVLKINRESNTLTEDTSLLFFREFFNSGKKQKLMECSGVQVFRGFIDDMETQWNGFKNREAKKMVQAKNVKKPNKTGKKRAHICIE